MKLRKFFILLGLVIFAGINVYAVWYSGPTSSSVHSSTDGSSYTPPKTGGGSGSGSGGSSGGSSSSSEDSRRQQRIREIEHEVSVQRERLARIYKNNLDDEAYIAATKYIAQLQSMVEANKKKLEEIKMANKDLNTDNQASSNSKASGDPVKITQGAYIQRECDIETIYIERIYDSQRTITGSFGYGWTSNLDQRVIFGIEPDAPGMYKRLKNHADELKIKTEAFKNMILKDFSVSSIETAESEISARIEACEKIINDSRKIPDEYGHSGKGIENEALNAKTLLQKNLEDVKKHKITLNSLLQACADAEKEAEDYRINVLEVSEQRRLRNKYSMFNGMDESYERTGINTVTVIDKDSYPHLLYESENHKYKNDDDKSIKAFVFSDVGATAFFMDGTENEYDFTGFLIKSSDRNENFVLYKRAPDGKIISIENSDNEKFCINYKNGFISEILNTRCPEEKVLYSYNGNLLSAVCDADGDTVTFDYDSDLRMTSLNKCDGSCVKFEYGEADADGKIFTTATINEENFTESFIYDRAGRKTEYIDHDGNIFVYYYDENHRTVREKNADGSIKKYFYDDSENLVRSEENGNSISYGYDENGNRLFAEYYDSSRESWTYDKFGLMLSYTDRDGVSYEYVRDEKGNLVEYKKGGKTVFVQEFDSKGRVIKKTVYGNLPVVTEYSYDSFGNLICEKRGGRKVEYEYDFQNRVKKQRINGKEICEYEYSAHKTVRKDYNGLECVYKTNGRKDLVVFSQKDNVTNSIHQTRIEYDKRHLPVRIFKGNAMEEELTAAYVYTAEGRIHAEIYYGNSSYVRLYEYKGGKISVTKDFSTEDITNLQLTDEILNELLLDAGENVLIQKYDVEILDKNRKLLTVTDFLEAKQAFEFDSYGNLVSFVDANGYERIQKFTPGGRLLLSQSLYGGFYENLYDCDGLLKAFGEKGGSFEKAEYNPDGSVSSVTDCFGNIEKYSYDSEGRLSSIEKGRKKTVYIYDNFDRVISVNVYDSSAGNFIYIEEYEYSENGRKVTVTKGKKYKTEYELDAFGNVITETDGNKNEKRFVWDVQNRMIESEDGYGNKTVYEYNASGKINMVVFPDGEYRKFVYNYIKELSSVSDEAGVLYSAEYDRAGRLIREKSRAESEKKYEYDKAGRILKVYCADELIQSYEYGINGRLLTVKDGKGADYSYNYDEFGRLASESNRLGLNQIFFYDEAGQLKSKTCFDDSTILVSYSDDRLSRTVKYSDGSKSIVQFDVLGNIVLCENENGKTVYEYDLGGQLVCQKDLNGGDELYFEYDAAGNRTCLSGAGRETTYTYGRNNELLKVFDNLLRAGVELEYDKNGREVLKRFTNGTENHTCYDKAGRVNLITQKNADGRLLWGEGYVYADDGKRNATVDSDGNVTMYEYDRRGRLSSISYPYTKEIIELLKEEAVTNGLPVVAEAGKSRFLTSAEKSELSALMNLMQRGLSEKLTSMQIFVKESYVYDLNGNRIAKITPFGRIEYKYDAENRLLSSGSNGKTCVTYSYDNSGNLLSEESALKTIKYSYNAQNRLCLCEVTDRKNMTFEQSAYAYDAFGRRVLVQDKGEAVLRTLYDGFTFDTVKQSPVHENGLFTDRKNDAIRYGATGRPTGGRYRYISDEEANDKNRYFYLDENNYKNVSSRYKGSLSAITANGTIAAQVTQDYGAAYFATDLLGSIRTVTDTYGTSKASYTYDAFGTMLKNDTSFAASDSVSVEFGYLGKHLDPTAKLYNYGFRDYSPSSARFTTVDPIRDGTNWFVYCNGDPVNFVDLDGRIQYPVSSLYTMQMARKDENLKGSTSSIRKKGCAVAAIANMLSLSIPEVNELYVENGNLQWAKVAKDYGWNLERVDKKIFSKKLFDAQNNSNDCDFYTIVNVNYTPKGQNGDHWVGVKEVVSVEGVDYIIISASSDNDSFIGTGEFSDRKGRGWKIDNHNNILVPVSETKGYRTFYRGDTTDVYNFENMENNENDKTKTNFCNF